MTETDLNRGIPPFDELFALLKNLVGTEIDPDQPLITAAVESLDIIEWVMLIEEHTGIDIADVAINGSEDLAPETTPRDVYNWLFHREMSADVDG